MKQVLPVALIVLVLAFTLYAVNTGSLGVFSNVGQVDGAAASTGDWKQTPLQLGGNDVGFVRGGKVDSFGGEDIGFIRARNIDGFGGEDIGFARGRNINRFGGEDIGFIRARNIDGFGGEDVGFVR